MKTTITLDQWLEDPRASYYEPIRSPKLAPSIGIHDTPALDGIRYELWHLADYRVESVQAGVIWLAPRRQPVIPPAAALRFEAERKGER